MELYEFHFRNNFSNTMLKDGTVVLRKQLSLRHLNGSYTDLSSFQVSSKMLELARKQRMNTDIRRNIFCTIMMSEDFLDAFEKLLK
jgi:hypothetical protein